MRLHISHDGYHGITDATIVVDPGRIAIDDHYAYIPVSHRVADRINRLCCGMDDCFCDERIATVGEYGYPKIILCLSTDSLDLEQGIVTMVGRYAQLI